MENFVAHLVDPLVDGRADVTDLSLEGGVCNCGPPASIKSPMAKEVDEPLEGNVSLVPEEIQ